MTWVDPDALPPLPAWAVEDDDVRARNLYGDPALRRESFPSSADPDAVEARAVAADAARGRLAAETRRADLSYVRAYRSRKGVSWPGYRPDVHGLPVPLSPVASDGTRLARPIVRPTFRRSLGLAFPRTVQDVRAWSAFDPETADEAHALVILSTVRHRFGPSSPCDCGPVGPLPCVCGGRSAARSTECACGAPHDAVCHDHEHVVDPMPSGRAWTGLRASQARHMHAAIDQRTILVPIPE